MFSRLPTALLLFSLGISAYTPIAAAEVATAQVCETERAQSLRAIVQRPEFARAQWGILLQPLDAPEPHYALNENAYFLPASTVKLLTTAAVLQRLGADYRIRTPIYIEGEAPALKRLILEGRGDPSLDSTQLQTLAAALKAQGVREIAELVVSDRYYSEASRTSSWEFEDLYFDYAPAISPLILNQNQFALTIAPRQTGETVGLSWEDAIAARQWQISNRAITVATEAEASGIEIQGIFGQPILEIAGSVAITEEPVTENISILNPSQYFLDTLRSRLEAEGIRIRSARAAQPGERWQQPEFFALESPPLTELIQTANQNSNNLYAEALLRLLGVNPEGKAAREVGISTLSETLSALGVDPESYRLADGSGLSRHNFVSPSALVQTLAKMAKTPNFADYRNSLAIAGVSGTLRNRFKNTPLQGKLWGKTGTMDGVSSLAGYLEVGRDRTYAFAIILNRSTLTPSAQRQAIDEIVLGLSALKNCSG
ncbi:D-alanyl-D-alanine carboxypeptidase/D-alanyl-D-alanine-endopeptidase [Oscillatoria sp. FACHB-1406]|uniref:D-alanyl-D-alanine carboxypeptidase/D-alanyl-D-alanine endopeptidase n=1 Tax=Oscillatoria sp. FACHB-1406 TaxID=2692846 RepID=UPI0016857B1C|nr:D-alanyl-D-alanine carboxypeptidase/D-alanyl-D-alanine-endopeptidase [Oscillatoria sp. FACHB-1406]MBD2576709.1 D-alanyl-D-alanine carboxypeptidase/D-alanyl-D-alanine-endopeptidase [Oscillatoria sp. FACHB-1406]